LRDRIRREQMPDMREANPNADFHFVDWDEPEKIVASPVRPEPGSSRRAKHRTFGWWFQVGDKVIQTENDYDKDVFNSDVWDRAVGRSGRAADCDPFR
jgi:hypothetical protein